MEWGNGRHYLRPMSQALHARLDKKQPLQKVYANAKVPNRRELREGISDMNTEKGGYQWHEYRKGNTADISMH